MPGQIRRVGARLEASGASPCTPMIDGKSVEIVSAGFRVSGRVQTRSRPLPNPPFANGYEDGYRRGREDARGEHITTLAGIFNIADRGCDRRYGTRAEYRTLYREGFVKAMTTVSPARIGVPAWCGDRRAADVGEILAGRNASTPVVGRRRPDSQWHYRVKLTDTRTSQRRMLERQRISDCCYGLFSIPAQKRRGAGYANPRSC